MKQVAETKQDEVKVFVSGTLKNPSRGPEVGILQTRLYERGYLKQDQIDEIFLRITEDAVKEFQADNDLVPDGRAGALTLAKLNIEINKKTIPPVIENKKGTVGWYETMFAVLSYDAGYEDRIANAAKRAIANAERYQKVAKQIWPKFALSATKQIEPWMFIAGLHNMEASGSFAGVLHNGEKIIGTGKKTTLVPAGRGPFSTWEASAIDVLFSKGLDKITDWSVGNILRLAELFNGTGYLKFHPEENTPYLWAMSNINDGKGKYVADGKYSETADSNGQVGFATLITEMVLQLSDKEIKNPKGDQKLVQLIMSKNSSIASRMVQGAVSHLENPVVKNKNYLPMINFGLNEKYPRLYVINLHTGECDFLRQVAHGDKSDPNQDGLPTLFSNVNGSHQSSLGAILIGPAFKNPKWKHSRLLYGLEPLLNGAVQKREIVMHTTKYVKDDFGSAHGDTWGCPGVSEKTGDDIMHLIGDCLLYIWAPEL